MHVQGTLSSRSHPPIGHRRKTTIRGVCVYKSRGNLIIIQSNAVSVNVASCPACDGWMGCMHALMHGCTDAWMLECIFVCMFLCPYICLSVCMPVRLYGRTFVFVCLCIYIYIHKYIYIYVCSAVCDVLCV